MLPEATDAVAAFSQQLGIHPHEDAEFGWLAEVGLQSPLPPRWTSHEDATTGYLYYVDHDRQVSSWENPLVPHLRRVVEIGRAYLETRTEEFFEEQKGLLWHQHKHDLACWHGPLSDAEGRSYYVNTTLGVSSWQDPRVDAQYIFELESGLLATLAEVLPPPDAPDTPGWAENQGWGGGGEYDPWRTQNGAEVMTLDDNNASMLSGGAPSRGHLRRSVTETMANWSRNKNRDEHKSALERMAHTAEWLRFAQQDEEEVQRLQFNRKVQERKKRRQRIAARGAARSSPGGRESVCSEDRPSLSSEPLGPIPGPERCSPASGLLAGRPVPRPLLSMQEMPDRSPPTPLGSPIHDTPDGTPDASPMPSPAASPWPPMSLGGFEMPPPPPPERGDPTPIVESNGDGCQTAESLGLKQDREEPPAASTTGH